MARAPTRRPCRRPVHRNPMKHMERRRKRRVRRVTSEVSPCRPQAVAPVCRAPPGDNFNNDDLSRYIVYNLHIQLSCNIHVNHIYDKP
jgi:hypothetical protein